MSQFNEYYLQVSLELNQLSPGFGAKSSNIEVNATAESSMKFKKLNS
jgi:hypothetical protein